MKNLAAIIFFNLFLNDFVDLFLFYIQIFYFVLLIGRGHETTGLEDITWVRCLKSLGTLPTVPLFEILHDFDLSDDDDDVSYRSVLLQLVNCCPLF